MKKALISSALGLMACATANAALYITPNSAVASSTSINSAAVLISDATNESYVAPGPAGGGGGTAWWTNLNGSTGITLTFDFSSAQSVDTIHIWDYYHHSASAWTISLYDGATGSGNLLHNESFNFTPGAILTSTYHDISVTHTAGVSSVVLTTTNNSTGGGVGLSEVAFGDSTVASVPEPSSTALLGLGGLALLLRRKK